MNRSIDLLLRYLDSAPEAQAFRMGSHRRVKQLDRLAKAGRLHRAIAQHAKRVQKETEK